MVRTRHLPAGCPGPGPRLLEAGRRRLGHGSLGLSVAPCVVAAGPLTPAGAGPWVPVGVWTAVVALWGAGWWVVGRAGGWLGLGGWGWVVGAGDLGGFTRAPGRRASRVLGGGCRVAYPDIRVQGLGSLACFAGA